MRGFSQEFRVVFELTDASQLRTMKCSLEILGQSPCKKCLLEASKGRYRRKLKLVIIREVWRLSQNGMNACHYLALRLNIDHMKSIRHHYRPRPCVDFFLASINIETSIDSITESPKRYSRGSKCGYVHK